MHRLAFIRRARDLGFSIDQIRDLLRLWSDGHRSSAEVKAIALQHVAELKQRARHLNEMAEALKHLASACEGNSRPECPIIKGLEGEIPLDLHCAEEPSRNARTAATHSGRRKIRSATASRPGAPFFPRLMVRLGPQAFTPVNRTASRNAKPRELVPLCPTRAQEPRSKS